MRYPTLGALCLLAAWPGSLYAEATGGPYQLRRAGFSSGAGRSTGGPYELHASLFRPDAHAAASGGSYRLTGGLLVESGPASDSPLFRNGFE